MRLIDLFPSWMAGKGIFSELGSWVPWADDETIDSASLDIDYFGNVSGYKETSPLLDKLIGFPPAGELSEVQIARIAGVIKTMYSLDWSKIWEAIQTEYNPLENYSMTESGSDHEEGTEARSGSKSETTENSANVVTEGNVNTKTKIIPFGGSAETEISESDSNSSTEASEVDNYGKTETSGSDADEGEHETDRSHNLTRAGNIGVTTSQQMLEAEINIRKRHYFEDVVFPDIDAILTSPIWRT